MKTKQIQFFLVFMYFAFSASFPIPLLAKESKFYINAGAGLISVYFPERESFPFYEHDGFGIADGRVQSPMRFELQDTTSKGQLIIGYQFGGADQSKNSLWSHSVGNNLRIEFSTNFYFPEESQTIKPLAPENLGSFVAGVYYDNKGMQGMALLGRNNDLPDIRMTADFDYIDLNLGLRSDYPLGSSRFSLSPYLGIIYANLRQKFETYATTHPTVAAILATGSYNYNVDENLTSDYLGGLFGLDLTAKAGDSFTFSIGGIISPLYLHTDMDISSRGDIYVPINLKERTRTKVHVSDTDFTYRALGKIELSYDFNGFCIGLNGILDYWENVSVVKYPSYNVGEFDFGGFSGSTTLPNYVPSIAESSMTNWSIMLIAGFYF